jgi:hypothetical protein
MAVAVVVVVQKNSATKGTSKLKKGGRKSKKIEKARLFPAKKRLE